jgi:nucleotide-binding universal stress UspA family protein
MMRPADPKPPGGSARPAGVRPDPPRPRRPPYGGLTRPVVAGIDSSRESLHALDVAVDEAVLRDRPLLIVHAWRSGDEEPAFPHAHGPAAEHAWQTAAEGMLAAAARRASERAPGVRVSTAVARSGAGEALVAESAWSELTVVGSRGLGGFAELMLGSVGLHVAAKSQGPVIVVRAVAGEGSRPAPGEVLVGVDALRAGHAALEFAFYEAYRRGVRLRALHAWAHPPLPRTGQAPPLPYQASEVIRGEAGPLAEALAPWREKYPGVKVVAHVAHEGAAGALVAASGRAGLVVVGAHHRRLPAGLALGSVNHAVLHHAVCPVALVPETT